MRLIDADSLKESMGKPKDHVDEMINKVICDFIDNAPTVEERPQCDKRAVEILSNYEKTACENCRFRPCGVPCELLEAVRYAIRYMKGG